MLDTHKCTNEPGFRGIIFVTELGVINSRLHSLLAKTDFLTLAKLGPEKELIIAVFVFRREVGWLNIQLMQSSIVGLNNGEGKHHGYFETKSTQERAWTLEANALIYISYYYLLLYYLLYLFVSEILWLVWGFVHICLTSASL